MGSLRLYEKVGTEAFPRKPLVMIFTEGTVLGPRSFLDHFRHSKYLPIKSCVKKIVDWYDQGAEIVYLTSRRKPNHVETIKHILISNGFPGELLYFREGNEKYKDIAEAAKPGILIEDDCRSIGGRWQMTITHVDIGIKKSIKSIVVREFKGIDHLPSKLSELENCQE